MLPGPLQTRIGPFQEFIWILSKYHKFEITFLGIYTDILGKYLLPIPTTSTGSINPEIIFLG